MLYILSQVVGWRKNMIIEEWRPIEETNGRNKTAQGFVWRYAEC